MLTTFTKRKERYVLTDQAKRKLWYKLPYRLRLKIEHSCFVARILTSNLQRMDLTALQRLEVPLWRKMSRFWIEIQKLNNPYSAYTNAPVFDKAAAQRINNFLSRFYHA